MKYKIKYIAIILLLYCLSGFSQNNSNLDKKSDSEISILKNQISELTQQLSLLQISLSAQEKQNSAQLNFYKENQSTVFWMISIFLIFIGGAFVFFGYLFKKPDEIWKKIDNTQKDVNTIITKANTLMERLEFQYNHQESIFLLGKKGLFDYTQDDWNLVEIYAKNAVEIPPAERKANDWLLIGLHAYDKKDYDTSILSYKKALDIDKSSELIWKHLGNAYDENGDYENSINAYKMVISINPNNDIAYNNLGIAYCGLNNFEKSKKNFIKGIRLNPSNCFIYTNYFELCLTNDVEIETELIENFVTRFKNNNRAMASFEMINIYKNVILENVEELDMELYKWEEQFGSVGKDESFREIENWIYKEHNSKFRNQLLKALNKFSSQSEYKNYA